MTNKLWTIEDLANYLGVPVQTIYQWRTKGYGPVGVRIGRHVRYRPEDVQRWLATLAEATA
jgi:excisionase family DNA binding protein